ncbi:LysM peptidoglycan-binding domain-containing protein [Deinococcus aquaedulcis]|uniref:LysM peptidoglycan-binding domain-containing protein n=1 Tax=Deinococcus aquaedulcis TaxID=2840455 RepID=UPI002E2BECF2|nr:LysM peptidoglycan-binding domain-containing protein [Deinococcus aquaedulcis]
MTHFLRAASARALLVGALLSGVVGAQTSFPPAAQPASAPATDLRAAATVTVQAGDTAYSLARRAGLSVDALLALNGLSTPALKVGQVLTLRAGPAQPGVVVQVQSLPAPTLSHTVQPGETLYALARRYGVTVDALLAASTLPAGAVLRAGQVLTLPPGAQLQVAPAAPVAGPVPGPAPTPAAPRPANGVQGSPFLPGAPAPSTPQVQPGTPMPQPGRPAGQAPAPAPVSAALAALPATDWRQAAMALVDTPYLYGGTTPRGTDCSGFVLQVFTPLGYQLPRTSADQARAGQEVAPEELQPGDLVFFDTEGRGRVTHVGIYLGEDQFVSANSYQGRVTVDTLRADRYWGPRYLLARRILAGPLAGR